MNLGVIGPDCQREAFKNHRLAHPGWCHDQAALPHTERSQQIDGPGRRVGYARLFQIDPSIWEHGGKLVELNGTLPLRGLDSFDGSDCFES